MPDKTPTTPTQPTEIDALVAQLETAHLLSAQLRNECAGYRVDRRTALFENAAYKQVIEKHNIGFDISKADLSKMVLENGAVVANGFEYTPKGVSHEVKSPTQPPVQTPSNQGITMESLKTMSAQDINKNWEAVSRVLETAK